MRHRTLPLLLLLGCATAQAAPAPTYRAEVVNPDLDGALSVDRTRIAWGSDGAILWSEDRGPWRHASTPTAADLTAIAADGTGKILVAVGKKATLLRSADGGRTWAAAKIPATETDLEAVVNVGAAGWIAAGSNGRILRSTDAAKTWKLVESNLTLGFQALFVDPATHDVLIGGEHGLVGWSKDGGESWQVTAISMPDPVTPVAGFERHGKLLLARSALGRFLLTQDEGRSWDLLQSSSKAFFTASAFDPVHQAIVITGHNGDVLRSVDGGASWSESSVELEGHKNYLSAIAFDAKTASLLVAGNGGTIARSTDGGEHWERTSSDIRGGVEALIAEPSGALTLVGPGGFIANSIDAGAHWKIERARLEVSLREVIAARGALVAVSKLGEILRSTDGGSSWSFEPVSYPDENTPPDLRSLVFTPSGDALIAGGPPGAILRARADGTGWRVGVWSRIEEERAYPGMVVDDEARLLLAVDARGAMRVSRDDGDSWQTSVADEVKGAFPYWQGAAFERAGVIVVAGENGRALRSADGARTWMKLDTGTTNNLYGAFADEVSGALYLLGAQGTLLRSADSGLTWSTLRAGTDKELRRMARIGGALICFGGHGALLRSQNGVDWKLIASGTDGVLRKSALEPATDNLLLAGSQGALLRTRDGGKTWELLPTHTARHFNSIAVDPASGDLVLVGDRIVRLVRQSR